jgi:hypothetical protein
MSTFSGSHNLICWGWTLNDIWSARGLHAPLTFSIGLVAAETRIPRAPLIHESPLLSPGIFSLVIYHVIEVDGEGEGRREFIGNSPLFPRTARCFFSRLPGTVECDIRLGGVETSGWEPTKKESCRCRCRQPLQWISTLLHSEALVFVRTLGEPGHSPLSLLPVFAVSGQKGRDWLLAFWQFFCIWRGDFETFQIKDVIAPRGFCSDPLLSTDFRPALYGMNQEGKEGEGKPKSTVTLLKSEQSHFWIPKMGRNNRV